LKEKNFVLDGTSEKYYTERAKHFETIDLRRIVT